MKYRVSPLIFIMGFVLIYLGYGLEFISYAATIIIHEMAHAEVSKRLGYSLNVIKLMPHGASLTGAFEGVKWSDEVLIALAGPLINIVLAVFCIALWWLIPSTYFMTEIFVISNVCTAAFNVLPIFPLDGGRATLAILSKFSRREKVYKYMRITGIIAAIIFCVIFVLSLLKRPNFSFAAIAVFIFLSTVFPDKNSKYQRLYSMAYRLDKLKNGLAVREVMVRDDVTFLQLMRMVNGNYFHRFILIDSSFNKVAEVNESELESLAAKCPGNTAVIKVLQKMT